MSLGWPSSAARAADPAYYDPVCPTASAAVQTYVTLVKNDKTLVSDAVAAAMSVTTAYDKCGDRFRSAGDVEHLHYASVGAAQYRFAAGRLLRLDDRYDEARIAFQAAIDEVGDTIAWGTTNAPSQYKDSAVEIRSAAPTPRVTAGT